MYPQPVNYGGWSGASHTAPGKSGNFFRPGHYVLRVLSWREGETFQNGPFAAVDVDVLGCLAGPTPEDARVLSHGAMIAPGPGGYPAQPQMQSMPAAMTVGEKTTHMYMRKHRTNFMKNSMGFVYAATSTRMGQLSDQQIASLVQFQQPLRGIILTCRVWMTLTRSNNKPFTKTEWGRALSPEEVQQYLTPEGLHYLQSNPLRPITEAEWAEIMRPPQEAQGPMAMPNGGPAYGGYGAPGGYQQQGQPPQQYPSSPYGPPQVAAPAQWGQQAPQAPQQWTPPGAPQAPQQWTPPGAPQAPQQWTPPAVPQAPQAPQAPQQWTPPPGAPQAPQAPQQAPQQWTPPGMPQQAPQAPQAPQQWAPPANPATPPPPAGAPTYGQAPAAPAAPAGGAPGWPPPPPAGGPPMPPSAPGQNPGGY